MRRISFLAMIGGLLLAGGMAWAQKRAQPRQSTHIATFAKAQTSAQAVPLTVSGGTVTFTSSNPNNSVQGSVTGSVSFTETGTGSFTIYALAETPTFTGCNAPPASSITVACSAPSGATCASPATLSSTGNGTVVATGTKGSGTKSFTVTYTFQDAWNYQVGSSCSLTVEYLKS